METVVSGIRPTGNLHLGNYFGAVKSFLRMQDEYNCFFFIADWHSLTTHPHPDNIRNSVKTILSEYLACGIDPEKATIYIQSDVPEVVELYLYLNMNAGIGELMRTASFKDKARQQLHISREGCEGDVEKEIFNEGFLRLKTDTIHTVKPLDISIPKGVLTTITGMSGSGKTTLILESLYPAIKASLNHEVLPQHIKELDASWVNKIDLIDASPIGNNVRSTVATYSGVFDHLRRLYSRLSDQYSAGDFSYNTGKLRCPVCEGTGTISMDIQFLPDIEMTCEHCDGTRYSNDVDSIMYHGHSIKDVMSLTILEALDVFKDIKKIKEKLQVLVDLGIGYLTLGEATPALSGGEAQRLKLASEIGKVQDGSIFIFDEPSIGLHPLDVETLLHVFDTLIHQKATIIVIEHDLDVIRNSDYIIDMGPEGGHLGGDIIATGPVEEIKQNKNSKIGKYL